MNTPRLFARPQLDARGWNSEMALRYGAATLVTLIALAAAQLVLPTQFMLVLGAITILGTPVSLWMRFHEMRIGGFNVPRPLWNALTVVASFGASAWFLRAPLVNILSAFEGGLNDATILRMGATEPMLLLVQLFLIFAAFRSFSLISDKDATLATVPSFSVLLLLVPVYPNIEVVCYFIVWTLVATMLFALDHRSEIRAQVTATVPAPAPGQDVKMATRSLAGVLAISLVAAVSLSGLLTARDPREASSSESAISLLATRLTRFSLQSEDAAGANGPQRQIDFSSGPSLPTRAELWQVSNLMILDGRAISPTYWRLFTLSDYDGSTWSQGHDDALQISRTLLSPAQWPRSQVSTPTDDFLSNLSGTNFRFGRAGDRQAGATAEQQPTLRVRRRNFPLARPSGFAISSAQPKLKNSFGPAQEIVRYQLEATRTTLGFLPVLPAPTALIPFDGDQNYLRVRTDGGVDASIITAHQRFLVTSQVPTVAEYGLRGEGPPLKKVELAEKTSGDVPTLSRAERARYLALPAKLPARVRQFARRATQGAGDLASNYARAQLLARATQKGASYTFRPPQIPAGRDAADFFLFDSRRGYCTYFAGALTVLCRAQGIPARVVSGFVASDGEETGQILLRDANAHAWTEIWVDNWGWAVVDATPPADRGDNAPTLLENWSDLVAAALDSLMRWSIVRWPLVLSGATWLLFSLGVWRFRRAINRHLGRVAQEDGEIARRQIAADYARVSQQLARRFRPRHAWETPDEWLRSARALVPQLPLEPLQTLTELYVRAQFSPRDLNDNDAHRAHQARAQIAWPKHKTRITLSE